MPARPRHSASEIRGRAGTAELLARERQRSTELEARLRELEANASQLESYALDLSRTYGELRRNLQHMTVLHEINTRIVAALDPGEVLSSMLDSLGQLIPHELAAVYLFDEAPGTGGEHGGTHGPGELPLLRSARAADDSQVPSEGSCPPAGGAVAGAVETQETVSRLASGAVELALPLRAGGRFLGVLLIRRDTPASAEEVKVLELLVAAVAVALHNALLYQETQRLATTDSLTGLSNQRHFTELLHMEVGRARRMGYPIGVMMMDLDHFKSVNDLYGHPAGDEVLRKIADVFRTRLRRTDVVGRVGGEEFGALLPGATLEEVGVVAEKVRAAVEELDLTVEVGNTRAHVTLSVGGISSWPQNVSPEDLLSLADQALYQAKRTGRNRVQLRPGPIPGGETEGDSGARRRQQP